MQEELQHLIQRLEVRASEKTAELTAGEGRIDMPDDLHEEPLPSYLEGKRDFAGRNGDLRPANHYSGIHYNDESRLKRFEKLKDDIEAISEAASLVKALIDSQQRPGVEDQ
jgi:hypothetical protein